MSKAADQLEFEHLPVHKMSRRTRKMARHDFEQVLTACARLASFSSGTQTRTGGPIDSRQEELAIDDLVQFAIHARRLIKNTTGKRRFSRVGVPLYKGLSGSEVSIWKLINTIIHYEFIEIFRSKGHLHAFMKPGSGLQAALDGLFGQPISPLMIVESDESKGIAVEIAAVIETFQRSVLTSIIDACDEQEFFLTDYDLNAM